MYPAAGRRCESILKGEPDMADKGQKDKGKREPRKKPLMTPDEKRKAKKEKKEKNK